MTQSVMRLAQDAQWLAWLLELTYRTETIEHHEPSIPRGPAPRRRRGFAFWRTDGTQTAPPTFADRMVVASCLVDSQWYRETYRDVPSDIDPLIHFLRHGDSEGRSPGPNFKAGLYLALNPDVRAAGAAPLRHFLRFGITEGRLTAVDEAPPALPDDVQPQEERHRAQRDRRPRSLVRGEASSQEVLQLRSGVQARLQATIGELAGLVEPLEFQLYRARIGLHRAAKRNEEVTAHLAEARHGIAARDQRIKELEQESQGELSVRLALEDDLREAETELSKIRAADGRPDTDGVTATSFRNS